MLCFPKMRIIGYVKVTAGVMVKIQNPEDVGPEIPLWDGTDQHLENSYACYACPYRTKEELGEILRDQFINATLRALDIGNDWAFFHLAKSLRGVGFAVKPKLAERAERYRRNIIREKIKSLRASIDCEFNRLDLAAFGGDA